MNDVLQILTGTLFNTVLTTIPIVVAVYFLMRMLMREFMGVRESSRYDDLKREAVLSEMRASYEHKISDLTREMVATRARWEDANHLIISGQRNQPRDNPDSAVDVAAFLKPYGVNPDDVKLIKDKIFVLTPFSQADKSVYDSIRAVCLKAGFIVARGDEDRAEGDILPQIIKGIVESRIIIANVSSRNPNVFFELGIAMALGKPTLLISDTLSEVPFDLQSRRIIIFKDIESLEVSLTSALLQTVRSIK